MNKQKSIMLLTILCLLCSCAHQNVIDESNSSRKDEQPSETEKQTNIKSAFSEAEDYYENQLVNDDFFVDSGDIKRNIGENNKPMLQCYYFGVNTECYLENELDYFSLELPLIRSTEKKWVIQQKIVSHLDYFFSFYVSQRFSNYLDSYFSTLLFERKDKKQDEYDSFTLYSIEEIYQITSYGNLIKTIDEVEYISNRPIDLSYLVFDFAYQKMFSNLERKTSTVLSSYFGKEIVLTKGNKQVVINNVDDYLKSKSNDIIDEYYYSLSINSYELSKDNKIVISSKNTTDVYYLSDKGVLSFEKERISLNFGYGLIVISNVQLVERVFLSLDMNKINSLF